jgi:enoyl-CoA hydratase/carnithine racemase
MPEDVILTSLDGGVATLTFNRPDKMNALSPDLLTKSIDTLARWEEDPNVAVVVVTGAGRAFCAGGDIGGMAQENTAPRPHEERIDWLRRARTKSASIGCAAPSKFPGGFTTCLKSPSPA